MKLVHCSGFTGVVHCMLIMMFDGSSSGCVLLNELTFCISVQWKFILCYLCAVLELLEFTLQQAEMRVIRWMCGIKITDRFSSSELRKRLGIDDIITLIRRHGMF